MKLLGTYRIIWILLLGGYSLLYQNLYAQCTIDTSIIIAPVDTLEFELDIQGLLNEDLEDPAQGICGVRLSFEHEYLGDIFIELISPGGQQVRLIGPEVTSGFTQLTQWDVLFVPCGFPTSPDPGFSGQWNNDQSWGILNVYAGIYHPFSGCLEDFNAGPANGTWTLRIVDRSQFYGGEIKSITLIFCDPAGLDCVPCLADAGTWILEGDTLEYCQNDGSLSLDTSLQYINGRPDTATYGYGWTVSSTDTIRQWLSTPDLRSFSPGVYTVCGLSYRLSDSLSLPDSNDSLRLDTLRQRLISVEPPFCGNLSSSCAQVIISPIPDTIVSRDTICLGDSLLWKGSVFRTPGIFEYIKRSPPACDTIFQLALVVIDLDPVISGVDTINCNRPSITLNAANSDTITGTNFSWTFNGMTITGTNQGRELNVSDSGTAVLTLKYDVCHFSDSVRIHLDTISPDINLLLDTVDCNDPVARLEVLNPASGSVVEWHLSGMIAATGPVWETAPAGPVSVSITPTNGCRNTMDFFVPVDTIPVEVALIGDSLTCLQRSATIHVLESGRVRSYMWSGPGLVFGSIDSAVVSVAGFYFYTAAGMNGCDTIINIEIVEDVRDPEFEVYLDTLTCLVDTVFPLIINSIPGTDYIWQGPGGTIFQGESPALTDTGTYVIRAISPAGCVKDTSFLLAGDFTVPDFTLTTDTLGCEPDTVQIGVNITDPIFYDYNWTGPLGFSSALREPLVDQPGQYIVTIISRNGCQISDSIQVFRSGEVPDITIESFGIDCNDSLGRVRATSSTGVTYQWTGPGNFSSDEAIITDLLPGTYLLTVTDDKGCQNTELVEIRQDISPPDIRLFGDTITCAQSQIEVWFVSPDDLETFFWQAPDNSTSTDSVLSITVPGLYRFFTRGRNGCASLDSIMIFTDTLPPVIQIDPAVINCDHPEVVMKLDTYDDFLSVEWRLPGGTTILSDSLRINEPGQYEVTVISMNGCFSSDRYLVSLDTIPPVLFFTADTLKCSPGLATINITPGPAIAEWMVQGPSGIFADSTRLRVDEAGIYRLYWTGDNGCIGEDSIRVVGDTIRPEMDLYADQIDCRNKDTLELGVMGTHPDLVFQWSGPLGFQSAAEDTLTGEPGWYFLESQALNGCRSIDSIFIGFDTLPPVWTISPLDTLDCSTDSVNIELRRISGPMRFAFDAPSGRLVNDSVWRTFDPGWYLILAEGDNACISIDSIELVEARTYPRVWASGAKLNCRDSLIRLNTSVDTAGGEYRWSGPMGFFSDELDPEVVLPGVYIVTYTLDNDCAASDTILIEADFTGPELIVQGDTITCYRPEVSLVAQSFEPVFDLNWKGPMGIGFSGDTFRTDQPGLYILEAFDSLGCKSVDTVWIHIDTSSSGGMIIQQGEFACGSDIVDLVAFFPGGTSGILWEWIGPDGALLGTNLQRISVDTIGFYTLRVKNVRNGCENIRQIELKDSGGSIVAEWEAFSPRCPGEGSGKLILSSLTGATGEISIFLNERSVNAKDTIDGLFAGMYRLRVVDSLGCSWTGDIVIPPSDTLWVDLGPDRVINRGDRITLTPVFNFGASGVQVNAWSPPNPSCPDCLIRTEQPGSDIKYRITIIDDRGCLASDEVSIFVTEKAQIFLPNAFTPNADGINDTWKISIKEDVVALRSLDIFDRWGNLVHHLGPIQVWDGMELWDGHFRGKPMNPGVFVYHLTYQLVGGEALTQSGDITIMR